MPAFRDLFIDRGSEEGRKLFHANLQLLMAGRGRMIIRGSLFANGKRRQWAIPIAVTSDEDLFWRGYYAAMRRLIAMVADLEKPNG